MRRENGLRSVTETAYYILAALRERPRHGYGIMRDVEEATGRRVRLGIGTLYENLRRLLEHGLVERAGEEDVGRAQPRKLYRITGAGRLALEREQSRLSSMVTAGRRLGALQVDASHRSA
jgi:DNA-binding PadR family transcriptional regulator